MMEYTAIGQFAGGKGKRNRGKGSVNPRGLGFPAFEGIFIFYRACLRFRVQGLPRLYGPFFWVFRGSDGRILALEVLGFSRRICREYATIVPVLLTPLSLGLCEDK